MFNVVLVEPEIPPNTGNVIRLCANTGAQLHLIEPLGFPLDDAKLRRAGLDYHEYAAMQVHADWASFLQTTQPDPTRMFAFTTRGAGRFFEQTFAPGDWFIFGSETRGLASELLAQFDLENGVAHRQISRDEFHSRIVRDAQMNEVPSFDDATLLGNFLLPRIMKEADADVMGRVTAWLKHRGTATG